MKQELKDRIARIKELAYYLPRGEWSVSGFDRKVVVTGAEKVVAIHADKNNIVLAASESEAAFIAAASPATLTEVIAELEECGRCFMCLATWVGVYDGHGDMPPVNAVYKAVSDRLLHLKAEKATLKKENWQLKAENARLKKENGQLAASNRELEKLADPQALTAAWYAGRFSGSDAKKAATERLLAEKTRLNSEADWLASVLVTLFSGGKSLPETERQKNIAKWRHRAAISISENQQKEEQ